MVNSLSLTYDPSTTPATLTAVVQPEGGAATVVVYAFGAPVQGAPNFIHVKLSGEGVVFKEVTLKGGCSVPESSGGGRGCWEPIWT